MRPRKQDRPFFDPASFKRKVKAKTGWLSPGARRVLAKNCNDRTEDDIDDVEDELREMSFFKRFPYTTQRELTRVMKFHTYRKGQMILREGHVGLAVYIIVAGAVAVLFPEIDKKTGEKTFSEVAELGHGELFGDVALIWGIRRTASIVCKVITQVLQLEKQDFDRLIKDILKRDISVREKALQTIPGLVETPWNEADYFYVKSHSWLARYPKDKIIIGGTTEIPDFIFFVVSGECSFISLTEFVVESGLGYRRLLPVTAPSDDNGSNNDEQQTRTVHKKMLEICTLRWGNYFGVGEDLSTSYIIALSMVECLMIPRFMVAKAGPRFLEKMKTELLESYPPIQVVLDHYKELQDWELYKENVVQEVLSRCPPKCSFGGGKNERPRFEKYF